MAVACQVHRYRRFLRFRSQGHGEAATNCRIVSSPCMALHARCTAVDYSTYRTQPRGATARTQALWRMFTWWITQYGQTQREPREVNILTMPSSDRLSMHALLSRAPDFGPAPDEEMVARDANT